MGENWFLKCVVDQPTLCPLGRLQDRTKFLGIWNMHLTEKQLDDPDVAWTSVRCCAASCKALLLRAFRRSEARKHELILQSDTS